MTTQHTPTPWFANGHQIEACTKLHTIICTTGGNGTQYAAQSGSSEAKANARLIAIAVNSHHDMLEALKFTRQWFSDNGLDREHFAICDLLETAIAKAGQR